MRYRRFATALATAALVGVTAGPSAAVTAERTEFTQAAFTRSITVVGSTGPLVRDTVQLEALFPPLTQGGFTLHRHYNPATMRGTVSGTFVGNGPLSHRGDLHGVITPTGMRGAFTMTRVDPGQNVVYRLVGTWETFGQPVAPTIGNLHPPYPVHFEGVIIGPFRS